MKKAFSLITSILTILAISGIMAIVSMLSSHLSKEVSNSYRYEQSKLLAQSYITFIPFAIKQHNFSQNGCLKTISSLINHTDIGGVNPSGANHGEGYRVTVRLQYIGLPTSINCSVNTLSHSNDMSVIADIDVRYKDPDSTNVSNEPYKHYIQRFTTSFTFD